MQLKEITLSTEKASICNGILRALPSWFGIEASIVDYVSAVQDMDFYAALDDTKPVGFVALKAHNPFTAEVYVMGILAEYHRQGLGRQLIRMCEEHSQEKNRVFLTVKTLDEGRESKSYEKTRLFYQSVGFKPLEVFPLLWDESNPCLYMAKYIG